VPEFKEILPKYLESLNERGKRSKVYSAHQNIGLELSRILEDPSHTPIYIKFAKNFDHQLLLIAAKNISERENIKNKGAYFTKTWLLNNKFPKKSQNESTSTNLHNPKKRGRKISPPKNSLF
jgi:hypothetical protein